MEIVNGRGVIRIFMKKIKLLNPWIYVKLVASTIALITNAVQLSEVSNSWGEPIDSSVLKIWRSRAELVSYEAIQIRRHLGVL